MSIEENLEKNEPETNVGVEAVKNIEEQKGEVLEFFHLSGQQKEDLKKKVEEHKGLVRVFIHPLLDVKGKESVRKILFSCLFNKNAPPVIIFEEKRIFALVKKILSDKKIVLPNSVYMVETLNSFPYPEMKGFGSYGVEESGLLTDDSEVYVRGVMKETAQYFKSLGINKILVGGTSLEIIDDVINRCIGNFIRAMKHEGDFDIKLSEGTAPLKRSSPEIRKMRPDLI